jgi:PAS domain S-box-containing protein
LKRPAFLDHPGEMARRIAEHDWSDTLGPMVSWPTSLRTAVALLLRSPVPMVLLWGADGVMIYNDGYSIFAADRNATLLGGKVREGWSEVADFNDHVMRVVLAGGVLSYRDHELTLYRTGAPEQVWMDLDYSPVVDDSGQPAGVLAVVVETTARIAAERRAAAERRRGQARLQLTLEASAMGAFVWFPEADRTEADARMMAIFDLPPDGELSLAAALADRIIPDDGPMYAAAVARALDPSGDGRLEARIRLRVSDGSLRWVAVTAQAEFADEPRRAVRLVGAVRDITDTEMAEEALRESEQRYRTLFEAIEVGFCLIDMVFDDHGAPVDYIFVEANPAFERQAGFSHVGGRRMREIVPDHEDYWFEFYGRVATTGESARVEAGSKALARWWEVHAFRVGGPTSRRVAVLFNDITARRRSDLALRELNNTLERRVSEALAERKILADIVEGADAYVLVLDPEYRWLAVNRAAADEFERIYGVRPLVGRPMAALFERHHAEHLALLQAFWTRALAGEAFAVTGSVGDTGRDARCYEMKFNPLCDAGGKVIGAYQFIYDITDRVHEQQRLALAEEQLRQSQKMEAMGQLTGGVAHDFNNLLTPIVGSLDILQRRGVGGEREQRLISGAMQSAERAKTLVQRLLAFARRQPLQPTAVDVGALVQGMADLVASTSGPQIKVTVDVAPDMPPARADPNQLEMALLNLSVNARDAMPDGGHLRISASAEDIGPHHHTKLPPNRYVRLSVADDGEGMDEATLARAIEPFFSTKGLGKGTGLGLSMVHGLALQLGGALTIHSRRGLGANVELWLPLSKVAVATPVLTPETDNLVLDGVALLVDDEELVRASTSEMLQELGYSVLQAHSAEDALRMVRDGLRPSVLITDHLMPGLSGTQLARTVQNVLPDLPVLIVSGYAELEGIDPDLERLTKPFRNEDLAASIARLMARPARRA